ncbi:flagellar assembly protein H [Devosia equisanguinis]|uniref:Flagellar assembly protein H n=1 Tax=Devosia equisanguinis TaxID=2490941 RepID=A0A3S4D4M8_9HYPH|nr:FliH/SctL family protein [Devosia equisanguinis]VDS04319.1 flagellar assembly protein H [Devosia equisanguinis]
MVSLARFTFDLDLEPRATRVLRAEPSHQASEPAPPPLPAGIPEDVVAQLVQAAREEAYAEGLAAGGQQAEALAAQTIAAAAGTIATKTAQMSAALDHAIAANKLEAIELAASVGRKLALHLVARHPLTELQALIAECLESLDGVPHLVIRCHPDLADMVREAATAQMTTSGFAGRLVVMGDPEIRLGDGRLEWVDGGLVRDIAATSAQIDRHIAAYLAAHGQTDKAMEHGA